MRIEKAQAREITPLFQAAVRLQIECWALQSEIEETLSTYFKNMEQAVADWAAASEPETIQDEDVRFIIENLEVEL